MKIDGAKHPACMEGLGKNILLSFTMSQNFFCSYLQHWKLKNKLGASLHSVVAFLYSVDKNKLAQLETIINNGDMYLKVIHWNQLFTKHRMVHKAKKYGGIQWEMNSLMTCSHSFHYK